MKVIADAYALGAAAWADGPSRIYATLANLLVSFSPQPLTGRSVLDLGSGTGVGSNAARHAGAAVVAVDLTAEMLGIDQAHRPPGAAGDVCALPFRDGAFDVALAPFVLNHLDEPAIGVREAGRVAPLLLASTYASDDDHPVKDAAETALREAGWARPDWYDALKQAMAAWGTVAGATAAVMRGGMRPTRVERVEVPFAGLLPEEMVAWRLGMAHTAPYFQTLEPHRRTLVTERALELLGPHPAPVVRRVIFLAAERAN